MNEWSIIIPALNEEAHIGSCLDSLCKLAYAKGALEVIIVDNGSIDHTVSIARSFEGKLNLTIIPLPRHTVAGVRNAGAKIAQGIRLAFLDSDCIVSPSWLQRANCVLNECPDSVIGAFYKVPEDAAWPARMWHCHVGSRRRGRVNYVPASNMLLEKALFVDLGGFDSTLASNEDSHFCAKAQSRGSQIFALPDLAVTHLGAEKTMADFVRRQFWHGSSVLNRPALRSNMRAIGLAVYTLFGLTWLFTAAALGKGVGVPATAVIAPAAILTVRSVTLRGQVGDAPGLLLLFCAYSLARALAFPVALFNCTGLKWLKGSAG